MTNDDIDKLEAGSDLDRLVAERVMWLKFISIHQWLGWYQDAGKGHYSTNIAHSWEVVEQLKHLQPEICGVKVSSNETMWRCDFELADMVAEYAETAPLAICRAALKAVHA